MDWHFSGFSCSCRRRARESGPRESLPQRVASRLSSCEPHFETECDACPTLQAKPKDTKNTLKSARQSPEEPSGKTALKPLRDPTTGRFRPADPQIVAKWRRITYWTCRASSYYAAWDLAYTRYGWGGKVYADIATWWLFQGIRANRADVLSYPNDRSPLEFFWDDWD